MPAASLALLSGTLKGTSLTPGLVLLSQFKMSALKKGLLRCANALFSIIYNIGFTVQYNCKGQKHGVSLFILFCAKSVYSSFHSLIYPTYYQDKLNVFIKGTLPTLRVFWGSCAL